MKRFYILILFTFFVVNLFSQEDMCSLMRERNEYYFEFELNDNYDIKEISTIVSIDKINDDRVVAYANAEQYERIISLGVKTSLLTPPSMLVEYDMYDNKCREEYSWDQYPTYEAYESMMYDFAERFPEKCSITELGVLESGRKILVARINDGVIENKPKFLYVSTIHGDETTGFMLLLRLIDYLLTNEELPEVRKVMDNLDIFICPNVNPDGTYYSGNHTCRRLSGTGGNNESDGSKYFRANKGDCHHQGSGLQRRRNGCLCVQGKSVPVGHRVRAGPGAGLSAAAVCYEPD